MKQALICCAIAFVITAAIGPSVIRYLRKMKFGQKILEIGPKWHMNKQNIPTMGGFMFIIGIALAVILGGLITGTLSVHALAILGLSAAYGAVGLVDDYAKIKKKENAGLTPRQKLVLQILVAAVFILVLFLESDGLPSLMIPFTGISIDLPWPVYIIFAAFVIVGADNAVNLTDGIDGLAASVTVPVAVFFAAVGARIGNTGVTIFAGALAGGLLGFLIYNFNPAKVFMGDTGSLFLGGAVAGMAFACDMPLILLLVGLIYIIETLSVILQVTYFKATHGKRLFKMAPIHHHFEMCGWGEKRIVLTFTAVTIVLCLAAYFVAAVTHPPRRWHNDIVNKTAARLGQPPESGTARTGRRSLSGAASLAPADAAAVLPPGVREASGKAAATRAKAAHDRYADHVRNAAAAARRPDRAVLCELLERAVHAGQRDLLHRKTAQVGGGRPYCHVPAEQVGLSRL